MSSHSPVAAEFRRFLHTAEPPELGAGPRTGVLPLRELNAQLDAWFPGEGITSGPALRLRALAQLFHDHHDAAHDLVQDLTDQDGALIHAVLHRREPDYWNAKYWFRRTDEHPVYLALGEQLHMLATCPEEAGFARRLTLPGTFDPFTFVDWCEEVARRPVTDPQVNWLRRVQHAEFAAMAEHLLAA